MRVTERFGGGRGRQPERLEALLDCLVHTWLGFAVLIASLGTVAMWRVVADSQQLVAINRELDIARQIQSSILPQAMPRIRWIDHRVTVPPDDRRRR